ncbi:HK97-gp10 family putative phage morphogenesis protein [Sphingomonas sp. GC_Shp_1]|uniref:HK97-gp10 family putative phage morphogenesis protein n=1 Tax=unclassified Sphingomonas TaxID=196159 RepID=UPI002269F1AA
MPKITGAKAHAARLKRLTSPAAINSIGKALFAAGELVADEAKGSLTRGSAGGHSGGKHQHVPSAPGQPPNEDTGHLRDNIETVHVEPLRVEVRSNAEYAIALEYGTSKMAERPYMRPALAAKRKEVVDLIRDALDHVDKGGMIR